MARRMFLEPWFASWLGFARVITAILIFVGLAGAVGAFFDATLGAGYYDLSDALRCLALAAFAYVFRLILPRWYRLILGALK